MPKLFHADLTNEKLRRDLGGQIFSFPPLNQGSDLYLGLRFSEEIFGTHVVVRPTVREIRVTIGELDQRPEAGAYSLKVGAGSPVVGTNVTASISFDDGADEIQTALNALSSVSGAVVTEDDDSFLVTGVAATIAVYNNTLRPMTFVRVSSYEVDGETTQAIRLQRAPLAFADVYTQKVPDGPSITRVQAGGSDGDIEWNEVQKLTVPIDFQGSYQVRSADGIQRTSLLGPPDTVETISAAMNPSLRSDGTVNLGVADDEDGRFLVRQHPSEPAALIEFTGSMAGAAHDLLTVTVFDAPEGDYWITVPLDTAAMAEAMRAVDKIKVPLEIWVDIEDPDDDEIVRTLPVYRQEVTINEKVTHDDLGTAANIDYLNPPAPKQYPPFTASQVTAGQRHYSTAVGNGSLTTFAIPHNLDSEEIDVRVRENTAGGALLIHGTDYTVSITNDNTLDVTVIGDYASPAPTTGALIVTVADLAATSTFDAHTHPVAEVTGLQAILDALSDRVTTLEGLIGPATPVTASLTDTGGDLVIPLAPLLAVYPGRTTYTAPATGELSGLVITGAPGRLYPAVHDTEAEALTVPVPTAATSYQGRVFQYSAAAATTLRLSSGDRLKPGEYAACDGRRWYRVEKYAAAESSWYPASLTQVLFDPIEINDNQFRLNRTLTLEMGLEARLFYDRHPGRERLTELHAEIAIEVGYRTADSSPGTPGSNLDAVSWAETPLVVQDVVITGTPQVHRIGVRISRTSAGRTLKALLYGTTATGTAPTANEFLLRGRLRRIDTEDAPTDARGIIALSGLARSNADEAPASLGRCVIS